MRLIFMVAATLLISLPLAGQQNEIVYPPGNGVSLPVVQKSVQPGYTQEARDAHIEGTVALTVVVRADGAIGDVGVARSLDTTYGLDEQAVKAMRQWLFTPDKKDGKPVAVRVAVEMTFNLKP